MMDYAGFWRRLAAYLLDGLVFGTVSLVIGLLAGVTTLREQFDPMAPLNLSQTAVEFVVMLIYFVLQEGSEKQATFGKRLLGLKVQTVDGERLTYVQALVRFLSRLVCVVTVGFGYLMVAWAEKKQGLHDKIAGTVVVMK
jgi:uncharacterized RDD family membrane protein YckC